MESRAEGIGRAADRDRSGAARTKSWALARTRSWAAVWIRSWGSVTQWCWVVFRRYWGVKRLRLPMALGAMTILSLLVPWEPVKITR